MTFKRILTLSVIFSLFMANAAYAANPKLQITYDSTWDELEIEYDDGTIAYADGDAVLLMINGDMISNGNAIIENGTTLVPLRVIGERLKADVLWNAKTKKITIKKGGNTIEMQIGNKTAKSNSKTFTMNYAPQIINGYTYVPIRAIAECFRADVGFAAMRPTRIKVVWVQDKTRAVKVSESEAIKMATDLYFKDFLPGMRDYVLECHNIDVKYITPSNIDEKSWLRYSGKCIADLGEYYYIEVVEGAEVLVDKYDGICYSAGGFSLLFLQIADAHEYARWGFGWQ